MVLSRGLGPETPGQNRTVQSLLPVAMRAPSGEKATALAAPLCPSSTAFSVSAAPRLHVRTLPSAKAAASVLPLAEIATALTAPPVPLIDVRCVSLAPTFHTRI